MHKAHSLKLGRLGEKIACRYLRRRGYRIIKRNYVTNLGEVDIIASDKDAIVFIEVKTRCSDKFGLPCESVDIKKRRKLLRIAALCIKKLNIDGSKIRFDVVSIIVSGIFRKNVELIQDAFNGDDI
ncbi:MAG: YraN family protein [Candidatus Omnitrophica bacterium]|nr:YraN family protein [Candidatus Omnitrophota bacterium]